MNGHVPGKPDDVAFIRALLDRTEDLACIDAAAVFATGVSNGGGMAARLGCDLSDRFAAIAPVAGGYGSLPACQPAQPVSVLEIHGTGDDTVPYYGKADGSGKVLRYLDMWRHLDGCTGRAVRTPPSNGVERMAWRTCATGSEVAHIRLAGEPHGWPELAIGSHVSATSEVWSFFSGHRRAG
jgi:polyhydroxybutyrate depolymerase